MNDIKLVHEWLKYSKNNISKTFICCITYIKDYV